MFSIIALAMAASTPSLDAGIDKVCGYALESVIDREGPTGYEIYVGRMEIRMKELHMDAQDQEAMRLLCNSYLLGAQKGVGMIRVMAYQKNARKE